MTALRNAHTSTPETVAEILAMYTDGFNMATIARALKVSHNTVRYHVHHAGIARTQTSAPRIARPATLPVTQVPQWVLSGACGQTDPELFFPGKSEVVVSKTARDICAGCSVQVQCLEWALANDEQYGVWGGTTAADRRKMKRRIERTTAAPGTAA